MVPPFKNEQRICYWLICSTGTPSRFLSTNTLYKLWHFEHYGSVYMEFLLWKLGGGTSLKSHSVCKLIKDFFNCLCFKGILYLKNLLSYLYKSWPCSSDFNSFARVSEFLSSICYHLCPQLSSCLTDMRLEGTSGGMVVTSQAFLAASSPLCWGEGMMCDDTSGTLRKTLDVPSVTSWRHWMTLSWHYGRHWMTFPWHYVRCWMTLPWNSLPPRRPVDQLLVQQVQQDQPPDCLVCPAP